MVSIGISAGQICTQQKCNAIKDTVIAIKSSRELQGILNKNSRSLSIRLVEETNSVKFILKDTALLFYPSVTTFSYKNST